MSLIPDSEFLAHQAYLGYGYSSLVRLNLCVQSGLNLIVDSEDIEVEGDMLYPYNQNNINVNANSTYDMLRLATEALQRHVTSRTGQTFNDYLFIRGLKVTQDFATLSELMGVTVNPINIQS